MQFMDLSLKTDRLAFYPRPETELLVEKALEFILKKEKEGKQCAILDIGTGSGNIAISLTKHSYSSRIIGLDISESALRVAEENASRCGVSGRVSFLKSDLFEALGEEFKSYFDLIISNPPYVSLKDFKELPEIVKDDPYIALYGGRDGLSFYRKIVKRSPYYLKKDAALIMEIGYDQSEEVQNIIMRENSFKKIELYKDYSGINRIVKAIKNG